MRSVFDVSLDILKVSGQESLPTLTCRSWSSTPTGGTLT